MREGINGLKAFLSWGSAPNPGVFGRHIAVFDGQRLGTFLWFLFPAGQPVWQVGVTCYR